LGVAAAAADRAGFHSVWTSELYNRSATVTLAALAPRTSACVLGSGIMYGVGRSPLMLAAERATSTSSPTAASCSAWATGRGG